MARRQLLTDEQWTRLLAPPSDEREIVRYWTLSREDFDIIFRKRSDHSRLGFALLLCYLRYPGRVLGPDETPPVTLVSFVARQLGVNPATFTKYSQRDQTRREQLAELMERLGYRSFDRASFRHYMAWLTPIAQNIRRPDLLVEMLLEELRRHRILIPTQRTLELLVHQARSRAERILYRALTNGLTDAQGDALDTLLNQKPEAATSWMGWLRQQPQAPAARNILALIERLRFVRELGIDADRQRSVSVAAFERLATDCLRTTVQHVRELAVPRRRAMLVAAVIRLESALNDATLFMFEKLLGSMSRKAERQTAEKSFQTLREVQVHLRTLTAACRAVIEARESTADPVAAVEEQVGWEKFVQSVVEAESLAQPETTDTRRELIAKYPTIRFFAAAFLEVFEFRGGGAVSNLLKALALISEMYRDGKRTLPLKPPTAFIRRAWRPFVFKDGDIDRRAYELCVFSELRNRLRAGDVWVDRSRQYQDFETYLIPKPTFEMLKAEGPLPVEIETEVQRYLESRHSALTQELATVATLAERGELPDVDLTEGDLKITPLRAVTPPEAESLRDAAYDLLPRIKITDLLLEVDRWTGFSECFTHQRNGRPAENKAALLTTILADGINLGLSRMAEACRGATLRQLAWVHDWHIREETYAAALSQLINAHRTIPLAQLWGMGTTSSSDGQYFRAGGCGEKLADINARHGNEPGVTFYTHLSDQFGPYYTKVIAATASEAPHVLDGLLYHQTGLQIEEHYTDTGGATDHVFGLCHLFGFRFAPRIRDLKDRRLYLFPGQKPHPMLDPLVGGFADVNHITAHWNDILRLATSIRSGTVTASAILQKLSAYPRQNGLAVALRDIGRVERTLFTLDWLKNIDLRRRANAGLNKGEARNALARAIFFYRLGEMRDRSFESQVYRASGLNLLIAAIILWNTRYLEQTFVELERQGVDVSPTIVAHVAPLGWEHVGLTGDYVWSDGQQPPNGSLRPLRRRESMLAA
jgi:TnpA family transposase